MFDGYLPLPFIGDCIRVTDETHIVLVPGHSVTVGSIGDETLVNAVALTGCSVAVVELSDDNTDIVSVFDVVILDDNAYEIPDESVCVSDDDDNDDDGDDGDDEETIFVVHDDDNNVNVLLLVDEINVFIVCVTDENNGGDEEDDDDGDKGDEDDCWMLSVVELSC